MRTLSIIVLKGGQSSGVWCYRTEMPAIDSFMLEMPIFNIACYASKAPNIFYAATVSVFNPRYWPTGDQSNYKVIVHIVVARNGTKLVLYEKLDR